MVAARAVLLLTVATAVSAQDAAVPPAPTGPLVGWTVALDPGHGGDDPGVAAGQVTESQLTLDLAQRTARALAALGARVVLTRDADVAATADARAALANHARASVFVSLHFNRSPRSGAAGAEVYTHWPTDEVAAAAGLTRWDRVQDAHVPSAEAVADQLVAALGARIPIAPTPRTRLPLRTLAGVDAPAVEVEVAYLSNPDQAAAAATPEFLDGVSEALTAGLVQARRAGGRP